jgi:hypothetical protein
VDTTGFQKNGDIGTEKSVLLANIFLKSRKNLIFSCDVFGV